MIMMGNRMNTQTFWIKTIVFYGCIGYVCSKVVGAFVLPHGGIALDPRNFNTTNHTARQQAQELHEACLKVGRDINNVEPDIIFLSTPHGLSDYKNFLIYSNSIGEGFGVVDDCLVEPCQYNLTVALDARLASAITEQFGYERNLSALTAFGPLGNDNGIPLRWGEVIPLLFPNNTMAKVVILSQPTRRYTDDAKMIPELLKLGNDIFPLLENSVKRIAVVISSDLAHTHKADGPYGYSNESQPFDDAIGMWAATLDIHYLLDAGKIVDKALSCGFTGLVMLHGLLSHDFLTSWKPTVYANLHPSYYGMMAASFHRKS